MTMKQHRIGFCPALSAMTLMSTIWEAYGFNSYSAGCFTSFLSRRAIGSVGTLSCAVPDLYRPQKSLFRSKISDQDDVSSAPMKMVDKKVKISIVGGGLAGITAASAIASRLNDAEIVVFEAEKDCNSHHTWTAATARNANSIVPGAAMNLMCQRSTLVDILSDSAREWSMLHIEKFVSLFNKTSVPNIDNFQIAPPYFALHLLKCLGPSATWDERWTFITFLRHFLAASLSTGKKEAEERAQYMVALAKANRHILLQDLEKLENPNEFGVTKGFLSLHRSKQKAQSHVETASRFDEDAYELSIERAIELEPCVANLPVSPVYPVHRPNDMVVNCLSYMNHLKQECQSRWHVEFRQEHPVQCVERLPKANERFRVTTADGSNYDCDYIILAAGINTPLLARQLNAGHLCPTYPLRGYSLSFGTKEDNRKDNSRMLLDRSISVDSIYCSPLGQNMARIAGFGELVGYRHGAKDVPSVGPRVLARYAKAIVPESKDVTTETALQCFRPMSPDDVPIAGKVSCVPGLYIHNGHGTMGWSLSLATAECVAQALKDDVNGVENADTFELPDSTTIPRSVLSPDRFT